MTDREPDDTDMTPEEFRAAQDHGVPVRIVASREEYEAEIQTISHITCPVCEMTSYNPNDIEQGYCGYCHRFTRIGW
jgi:hypothetical protein